MEGTEGGRGAGGCKHAEGPAVTRSPPLLAARVLSQPAACCNTAVLLHCLKEEASSAGPRWAPPGEHRRAPPGGYQQHPGKCCVTLGLGEAAVRHAGRQGLNVTHVHPLQN